MLNIKTDQVVTITGMRGTGKSHLFKQILKKSESYLVYDVMHEHGDHHNIICSDLETAYFHLMKMHKKIIYQPESIKISEFDWLCEAVYRTGDRMFFVEEANRVMPNNQISEHASQLCDLGRHRNVGMVAITRRIALLDKLPVSQSNHIIIFKTILPNDIRYLQEFVGKMAQEAPNLRDYKFIYYSDEGIIIHGAI